MPDTHSVRNPGGTKPRFLEDRFETRLPVFQGRAGQYDPLDAMRRDAYREVFLYIHHQLELARQEASSSQT